MLDQARTLLVKEISVARGRPEDEILIELNEIIDESQGPTNAVAATA